MESVKENQTITTRLFHEWLNNLAMYGQELNYLNDLVGRRRYHGIALDAAIELDA